MKLSELLWRAAVISAAPLRRRKGRSKMRIPRPSQKRGKSEKGLVWVPNKIRKRFGMAEK
jgi:hypothetical protein